MSPVEELLTEIRDLLRAGTRQRLSCRQAAALLGTDRKRLGRLVKAGVVKGERDGTKIVIAREEVDRIARDGLPPEPKRRGRPRKPLRPATRRDLSID